jgi:aryl-alcohol dehydrogenase-like predicted oxidoreductase
MAESPLIPGRATLEGTGRFAARFPELPGHFRRPDDLHLSSLGLGLRSGEAGGADDFGYRESIQAALQSGINVFDTALSDRMQTSERVLGAVIGRAIAEKKIQRDEVVVISKAGFLAVDADFAPNPREARTYLQRTYVETGLVLQDTLAAGRHCMEPAFLEDQIERSRRNLGLGTIDFYLLEEPELHLQEAGPDAFRERLVRAIDALEAAARKGSIGGYGLSTWSGLLLPQSEAGHLSLVELFELALERGGADHHMRAIQFPYGVGMADALGRPSQFGPDLRAAAVLDLLGDTGTAVFAISPLYRGRVIGRLPNYVREYMSDLRSDAQRALQFARSAPSIATALVGMRSADHVEENMQLAQQAPLAPEVSKQLLALARESG